MNILFKRFFYRFLWSVIALLSILIFGTVGYHIVTDGRMSLFDSLFMTVITITSVGYAEIFEGNPYTHYRLITLIIVAFGIGTATYIISNITALIVEGELGETFKKKKMEKKINRMDGHYIICGVGRVGHHIMNELLTTRRPFVIVDINEDKLKGQITDHPDIFYVIGGADSDDTLIKAGIRNAKGIFASTGDDNDNLVISLTAKYLNPNVFVVARCLNGNNYDKIKKAGADIVVNDNFIAGMRMASEMIRPTVTSFLDKMLTDKEKNLRVEEVTISEKNRDVLIKDIFADKFPNTLVLAIADGESWHYNPKGDTRLKPGSRLILITNPEERELLNRNI